jgi:hypothetical protein
MNGRKRKHSVGYGGEEGDMVAPRRSPPEIRAQDHAFVHQCSFAGLRPRLPLRWPTPSGIPDSPKKQYRSYYVYLGFTDLDDRRSWRHLSSFDLVLRLVDFNGLRPVLAWLLASGVLLVFLVGGLLEAPSSVRVGRASRLTAGPTLR